MAQHIVAKDKFVFGYEVCLMFPLRAINNQELSIGTRTSVHQFKQLNSTAHFDIFPLHFELRYVIFTCSVAHFPTTKALPEDVRLLYH